MEINYKPSDLTMVGEGLNAYIGMFRRAEWERLAAFIVKMGQEYDRWMPVKLHPLQKYRGMIEEELIKPENGGYVLTPFAVQKIMACQNNRSGRI